jgi:ubiquitin-conjugating enzyme E2 O
MERATPLGLQQDDVVRLTGPGEHAGVLAFVEHVGGDTSEEEDEDAEQGDEDEFAEHFGLPRWAPPSFVAEPGADGVPRARHFINTYDDDEGDGAQSDSEDDDMDGVSAAEAQRARGPTASGPTASGPTGVGDGGHEHAHGHAHAHSHAHGHAHGHSHGNAHPHLQLHPYPPPREEVPVGAARVSLVEEPRELVIPVERLVVEDRAFIPGDVVHRSLRYRVAGGTRSGADADAAGQPQEQSAVVAAVSKTLVVRRMAPRRQLRQRGSRALRRAGADEETFEIPSGDLSFFSGLRDGCFVVCDDWLGRVQYFHELLTVRFAGGASCKVFGDPESVLPVDVGMDTPVEDVEGVYYPGQYVRAPPAVWREANWVSGSYRHNMVAVVEAVEVTDIGVDWMAKRVTDEHSEDDGVPPPDIVKLSQVTPLVAFRNLWWRVGDRGLYKHALPGRSATADNGAADGSSDGDGSDEWEEVGSDEELEVGDDDDNRAGDNDRDGDDGEWEEVGEEARAALENDAAAAAEGGGASLEDRLAELARPLADNGPEERALARLRPPTSERVLEVVNTRTYLDLKWQDGTESKHVPAVTVLSNHHLGAYDYFPGIFVSEAPDDLDEGEPAAAEGGDGDGKKKDTQKSRKNGVVARVNPKDRTAAVRWQVGETSAWTGEEEVSVYELTDGQFDIRLGDTVLRVIESGDGGDDMANSQDWVGEVIGTGVGVLHVQWLGGTVDEVSPKCLIVVGGDEDEEETDAEAEGEIEGDFEEEDAAGTAMGAFGQGNGVAGGGDVGGGSEDGGLPDRQNSDTVDLADNWAGEDGSGAVWEAPNRAQGGSGVNMRAFAAGLAQATGLTGALAGVREAVNVGADSGAVASSEESMVVPAAEKTGLRETKDKDASDSDSTDVAVASANSPSSDDAPADAVAEVNPHVGEDRFAMLDALTRHHFESGDSGDAPAAPGFPMVVRKEFTRLSRHLPPGIFVHASESRLDLLRAAIVGPSGTPYEDVLFFFDILLPPDYPTSPPKVHFMAHNRRLSPNLYETGKVCLSLLGTWDGDGVEKWDPRNSNLLRVLLSIQAMVLVDEPYYTEAGYEKQAGSGEGRANSLLYNESALLLGLRHVVSSLRYGGAPEDFEEFTATHYRALGPKILGRCKKLLAIEAVAGGSSGAGPSTGRAAASSSAPPSGLPYSSVGFKRSLEALLPRVEATVAAIKPPGEGERDKS